MAAKDKDKMRSIMRRAAAEERERIALDRFIKGKTYRVIGETLGVTEGAAHKIVHRALARRAEAEGETVTQARQLYTGRLEYLMAKWMPYADGTARDSLDEQTGRPVPGPPDPRMGELLLRALDKWGEVMGVRAATPDTGPDEIGPSRDAAAIQINIVLDQLAAMRAKSVVIEGSLAAAGVTLDDHAAADDRLPPPPLEIPAA